MTVDRHPTRPDRFSTLADRVRGGICNDNWAGACNDALAALDELEQAARHPGDLPMELDMARARVAVLEAALGEISDIGAAMDADERGFDCGRHDEPNHDHEFYFDLWDTGHCVGLSKAGDIARAALGEQP